MFYCNFTIDFVMASFLDHEVLFRDDDRWLRFPDDLSDDEDYDMQLFSVQNDDEMPLSSEQRIEENDRIVAEMIRSGLYPSDTSNTCPNSVKENKDVCVLDKIPVEELMLPRNDGIRPRSPDADSELGLSTVEKRRKTV